METRIYENKTESALEEVGNNDAGHASLIESPRDDPSWM